MKNIINSALLVFIVGLASNVFAAQAVPLTMSVSPGSYSGGVASLAKAGEGKVVNLYTSSRGNLTATFQFSASGLSSVLVLNARFLQLTGRDIFTFQFKNSSGAYTTAGTTSGSASVYKTLSFVLPPEARVGGSITIRLISSTGSDDTKLDFLAITDSGVTTPPPPPTTTLPNPTIPTFAANPATISVGQSSMLSWSTTDATSLVLNPGAINVTGSSSYVVMPMATTSYTLTATNASGSTSKSLSVAVMTSSPTTGGTSIAPGTKWYWQLQGTINTSKTEKVYDIDLYDNSASLFASLKASGHTVICYFSAGTYEDWRSDANQFPAAALGSSNGWPGEKWIDVRNATVRQIMANRMDMAKSKGCDGLEPDNVDGYANKSGFPLTAQDQVNFNTFLADQAHARGMIIALKNTTDLVDALVDKFDFAVVEECFKYNECSAYSPFIAKNKAVLNAEYSSYSSAICSQAASLKFSTVFFNLNLDGKVFNPCP